MLDVVANRYADSLFSAERERLSQEWKDRLTTGGAQQTHSFLARYENTGMTYVGALVDARANSLLAAHIRARVPIDDRAVSEICLDVGQVCEAAAASIAQHIRDTALRTSVGQGLVTPLLQHIAMEVPRIGAKVRLKLTAKRDEAILDGRAASELDNSKNERSRQYDELLGLFTKGEFEKDLDALAAKASANSPLSLLFIDLDHFKSVNDSSGHLAGDEVLVATAKAMGDACEGKGLCYRWGGEELVALLPNYKGTEAAALAERIREAISGLSFKGYAGNMTASIGVASHDEPGVCSRCLVDDADKAMYEAKDGGRDRVCVAGGSVSLPVAKTRTKFSPLDANERLEKVRLWVKLESGLASNFLLIIENLIDQEVFLDEIKLESDGIAITEPALSPIGAPWKLPASGQRYIGWWCRTDPSATLTQMNSEKGLPFQTQLRVVLICSLSGISREFEQMIPVQVFQGKIVSLR